MVTFVQGCQVSAKCSLQSVGELEKEGSLFLWGGSDEYLSALQTWQHQSAII